MAYFSRPSKYMINYQIQLYFQHSGNGAFAIH